MTKEEKLKILGDAEDRAYKAVGELDVTDERFGALIYHIDSLRCALERLEYSCPPDAAVPVPEPDIGKGEVEPEKKVKLDPIEEPAPVEPAKPSLTKGQMVSKLTPMQNNGVDIKAVMESIGYSKLSDVPADRYWELLELCQKAADGEG